MSKNIVLVGAGGLARDILTFIGNVDQKFKGVLVDDEIDYKSLNTSIPYLGKIREYGIQADDELLIAIGENPGRKIVLDFFVQKGAHFYSYVHPTAIIPSNTLLAEGVIVGPYCVIGSNTFIGKNVFINKFCNVGHDVSIQENCIMYPYAMIGGNCNILESVVIATRSTIAPKLTVGNSSVISAHTFVKKSIEANSFIFSTNKNEIKKRKN